MRFPEIESTTLELKSEIPKKNQLVNTAIGFCNIHGGKIVIGVADDRTIIGMSEQNIEQAMESIQNAIYDACSPTIIPRLYTQQFKDKTVLMIEISEGMNKPYYRRSEGIKKGTYVRFGRHTLRASADIIQELQWQGMAIDFECLPVYQSHMEDLDMNKIKAFLDNRKNHGKAEPDEQILRSYNIITYDQSKKYPSVLGILLFGKNPQIYLSEAMIICTHFNGIDGRDVIATIDCEGTLFNQFQQAFNFITQRLSRSFKIKSLKREEKLEIPLEAIREALLNAIVHRNYHIKAPTKISIYNDRIEFFSPGQFPGPININNLTAGITYLRNPMLCKVLREAHYIEKLGSGFITIFSSYNAYGLTPPHVIEGENYIKCILPREPMLASKPLTDEAIIMDFFKLYDEINIRDIMLKLTISRATAVRKLNALIKKGFLERTGETKAIRYRLKIK